jgi:hypothetical protein
MRGSETIQVIPAAGRDEWGDPLPAAPPQTIRGCTVIPRRTNSPERGLVFIDGYEVFAPPVAAARAVTARDTIHVRGEDFQVEGTPGEYVKAGTVRAVQMFLKRVGT